MQVRRAAAILLVLPAVLAFSPSPQLSAKMIGRAASLRHSLSLSPLRQAAAPCTSRISSGALGRSRAASGVARLMSTATVPETSTLALADGRMKVKEIQQGESSLVGKEVVIKGWVRTIRNQKTFSFIEVNDGSGPKGIQARWIPHPISLLFP